jgi:uncharacterized protein (DUF885 family)
MSLIFDDVRRHMTGPLAQLQLQMCHYQPTETAKDLHNFNARLSKIPERFEDIKDNLRAGILKGLTLPAESIKLMIQQCRKESEVGPDGGGVELVAKKSPLNRSDKAAALVGDSEFLVPALVGVVNAFASMAEFLEKEYLPHARKNMGIYGLPGVSFF